MNPASEALCELGRLLAREGYRFVTPTPETHARVIARRSEARDLRDVFGWSLPFRADLLPPAWLALLREAGVLHEQAALLRAEVRFSTLGERLWVHSAYPTLQADAVFFGPDSYRFCDFIEAELSRRGAPVHRVLDLGCGSGVGGLIAARASAAEALCLADINPRALALAEVNAALATSPPAVQFAHSDLFSNISGTFDLIVSNPPYMRDEGARVYRDGGGDHGEALSVRIVREALPRLAPGGVLLLYTGAAIVAGQDVFFSAVRPLLAAHAHRYRELDPDVFGEQLALPGYREVERIAAVGLVVERAQERG